MHRLILLLLFSCLPFSLHSNTLAQLKNELLQQQYSRAATTGLALLRKTPQDDQILFLTALAFQQDQQPQQALKYYQQLNQHNPGLPEPLNNMALIHLQQGDHDQAVDALIASLKTHPAYATAWQNLRNLYQGLASEAYRKALSEENKTSKVLDKIQLTALNNLHSLVGNPAPQKEQVIQPIQLDQTPAAPAPNDENIGEAKARKPEISIDELEQQLIQTVKNWASAWSNRDFENYVNAYTDNYKGGKSNHRAWVDYRRSRILQAGKINVNVNYIRIKSRNAHRAIIDFEQAFKSPTYRDRVVKRIILTKQDNHWKISQERILSVL